MRPLALLVSIVFSTAVGFAASPASPNPHFTVGELLVQDDFRDGTLARWQAELESGGSVSAREGALDLNVPAGCSLWLKQRLSGPLLIEYRAVAVAKGGPNDRVSDLNCFWMATDSRSPGDLFATTRTGKFADYDPLRCYYGGLGGNSNTTTRFRRYIGEAGNRPLRSEHDLSKPEFLLTPNVSQHIELLAVDGLIEYYRDGRRLFTYNDPNPYREGWFAFRTTKSHLQIREFRVWRLMANPANP